MFDLVECMVDFLGFRYYLFFWEVNGVVIVFEGVNYEKNLFGMNMVKWKLLLNVE